MNSDLLNRFYKGECSQEEAQTVLKWFREKKLGSRQEEELYLMWQESGKAEAKEGQAHDAGKVLQKIKAQIKEKQDQELDTLNTERRFLQLDQPLFWFRAAAVLLPLCLVWVFYQQVSHNKAKEGLYTTIEAAPGVRKTIDLPDGSLIRLNSGGKVTFQKEFTSAKREVELHGEAFFEVAKDSLRPFIVHTGAISTQALGTSFNIDHSSTNGAVIIALASGVVRVDKQGRAQKQQLAVLRPGQQISYSKVSQQYEVSEYNKREVLGWKDGVLFFKSANLDQIVQELENWYGVDIKVDRRGMLGGPWNYTGEYSNESLEKVLEGIGYVKDFSYSLTGKNVDIVFNKPVTHERRD